MNSVARLRRLPARYQRLVAGAVLVLVLVLVPLLVVGPVVAKHLQYAQHSADLRYRLERTRSALERLPRLASEVEALERRTQGSTLYLDEASPSVAGASVQQIVSGVAEETNAALDSSRVVEPETRGNVTIIGVRLDLHGEIGAIASFLRAVESHEPVLIVRELDLEVDGRRTPRNRAPHQPVILGAQVDVQGIMRSGGE